MAVIITFVVAHWFLSLFSQTFFLHRYSAHRMFSMNAFWEKFFFVFTWFTQGSSYLHPRAYAVMHRMHHAYSDTERDPHSPHFFRSVVSMMVRTKNVYRDLVQNKMQPGDNFEKNIPAWDGFEWASGWTSRIIFTGLYIWFYATFATEWWMWLLFPVTLLMGPIHGGIVNWCGHKYGYVNFPDTDDHSKNSLALDFVTMGELFQNNHHKYPGRPNFAVKMFELDPTYPVMKLMSALKIIKFRTRAANDDSPDVRVAAG